MVRDLESWICLGLEFQSLGAALENALSSRFQSFAVWMERRAAEIWGGQMVESFLGEVQEFDMDLVGDGRPV